MAWPLGAGTLLLDGYGFGADQPVIRTPMEQGPQRKTLSSQEYSSLINVQVQSDADELQTFINFFEGEANYGTGWFDMDIITRNTINTHSVRIENFNVSAQTNSQFRISLQLETRALVA